MIDLIHVCFFTKFYPCAINVFCQKMERKITSFAKNWRSNFCWKLLLYNALMVQLQFSICMGTGTSWDIRCCKSPSLTIEFNVKFFLQLETRLLPFSITYFKASNGLHNDKYRTKKRWSLITFLCYEKSKIEGHHIMRMQKRLKRKYAPEIGL